MIFFSSVKRFVLAACWLTLRLLWHRAEAAETVTGSLRCDSSTLKIEESSRTASCAFTLDGVDNADLFHMEEFTFYGMDDNDAEASILKITSTLETLEEGSSETTWMGSLSGSLAGLSTFVQGYSGGLAGNFKTDEAAYSVIQIPAGPILVRETLWKDAFEPSDAVIGSEADIGGDIPDIAMPPAVAVSKPKVKETTKLDGTGWGIVETNSRRLDGQDRKLQAMINVDVLVIVTNRAMCESAGVEFGCDLTDANKAPIMNSLGVVLAETNTGMQEVGVPVKLSFVQYIFTGALFDPRPSTDTLTFIAGNGDIQGWRDEIGADLVTMVTGPDPNKQVGGIAWLDGHQSATDWTQLSLYSMTHELYHCFGAHHNREDCSQPHPYASGFQVPSAGFRTVMAYKCRDTNCPLVPFLSSDEYSRQGFPLGDASHNNARMVREKAVTVSNNRPPSGAPSPGPIPGSIPSGAPSPGPIPGSIPGLSLSELIQKLFEWIFAFLTGWLS